MGEGVYEYSIEGYELSDGEYGSIDEAVNAAHEDWAEQCLEGSPRNGEVFLGTLEIYEKTEYGIVEVPVLEDVVEYEHYHGDYAEHFHQGDYI